MKKILGVIAISFLLVGCATSSNAEVNNPNYTDFNNWYRFRIITDKETGAKFAVVSYNSGGGVGITQVMDKDGKPLYEK